MKKYYDILGLPSGASKGEIKKAYYKLAKKYHPDISQEPNAEEKFIEINEAYELLTNPDLQRKFQSQTFSSKRSKPQRTAYQRRARAKAKMKAKMKAQDFKKLSIETFKRDKKRLVKMFCAILLFPTTLTLVVWEYNEPNREGYDPNLPIHVFLMTLIPVLILSGYISYIFYKTYAEEQFFKDVWKKG